MQKFTPPASATQPCTTPAEGTRELQSGEGDAFGHVRLGGIGERIAAEIENRTGK